MERKQIIITVANDGGYMVKVYNPPGYGYFSGSESLYACDGFKALVEQLLWSLELNRSFEVEVKVKEK